MNRPALVISLDFELHWGVRDHLKIEDYKENLLGARQAVPALLKLFEQYGIHATWATVGFLFCKDKQQLLASIPKKLPHYLESRLSPYECLNEVGRDETEDPFHFAPSLISLIAKAPFQEIATHTLSHYYCLEPEQDTDSFRADLESAQRLTADRTIELKSIVFPRNQYSPEHLEICHELGITSYRGNEPSVIYEGRSRKQERTLWRALRFADAYLDLTGASTFCGCLSNGICNIPSSRFLRPYSPRLRWLEPLRLNRILNGLNVAARKREAYHLWWHPHNFGKHLQENMEFLEKIVTHVDLLRREHGMESLNMAEMAARIRAEARAGASA